MFSSRFHRRSSIVQSALLVSAAQLWACGGDEGSKTLQLQQPGGQGSGSSSQMVPVANLGDANQSGVSTGTSTSSTACGELLACAGRCGENEACAEGCVERAGDVAVSQLRALFVCVSSCEQVEDSDACGERNCVEPLITCLGGRKTAGETVTALRSAFAGRELSRTDTWTDNSSGAVGFATETKTEITLCSDGQFAYQEETQNFASGNVGGDDLSAMSGDSSDAQGRWQIYSLDGTYILELARSDGRTQVMLIAVESGALYLDGEAFDVGDATGCP